MSSRPEKALQALRAEQQVDGYCGVCAARIDELPCPVCATAKARPAAPMPGRVAYETYLDSNYRRQLLEKNPAEFKAWLEGSWSEPTTVEQAVRAVARNYGHELGAHCVAEIIKAVRTGPW